MVDERELDAPATLGIIAGNGRYPFLLVEGARKAGVARVVVAAFAGETDPALAGLVDEIEWLRVGQLGRLVKYLAGRGVKRAIMAGQIAPKNLFDLRPDVRALVVLATLKERNAESLFGAIANELAGAGVELLEATTYMGEHLATEGVLAGPKPDRKTMDDVVFGLRIAKEVSRLDIGQTVVVRRGTVLAVEAFEGTNAAIRRGGELGKKGAVAVKVSKPGQDLRFDVPVIGPATLIAAAEVGLAVIAVEAGKTLVLDRAEMERLASDAKLSVVGVAA